MFGEPRARGCVLAAWALCREQCGRKHITHEPRSDKWDDARGACCKTSSSMTGHRHPDPNQRVRFQCSRGFMACVNRRVLQKQTNFETARGTHYVGRLIPSNVLARYARQYTWCALLDAHTARQQILHKHFLSVGALASPSAHSRLRARHHCTVYLGGRARQNAVCLAAHKRRLKGSIRALSSMVCDGERSQELHGSFGWTS